jgi:hypothetical protein
MVNCGTAPTFGRAPKVGLRRAADRSFRHLHAMGLFKALAQGGDTFFDVLSHSSS